MSYEVYLDTYDPSVVWSRLYDRFTYAEYHQLHEEVFTHIRAVPYSMKHVLLVEGQLPRENLAKHMAQVATQRSALPNLGLVIEMFTSEFARQYADTVSELMTNFEVSSNQPQVYRVLSLEGVRHLLAQHQSTGV